MMLHPAVETLFREFEQAGLRWCVLRMPVAPGKSAGDIDLLLDPADLPRARELLTQSKFVQLPGWSPGLHFIQYDAPTDCWMWFHVTTELSFGPYAVLQTHAEAACLDHRRHDGSAATLAPEDSLWVLLLHCLLDKGSIATRHRKRLQELASNLHSGSPLATLMMKLYPPGWNAGRIEECVSNGKWVELEELGPALKTRWMQKRRIGTRQLLRPRVRKWIGRLWNLRRHRGLGVALLGPDGAGKSTLISAIQESFIFPVQPVYMGLTGGFLRYADWLVMPFFVIPARLFIFWCRYLRALWHQAQGRLVIFDRYIYDYMVPTPFPLNPLKRAYRWIDGHALPGPDLALVLDAPGEVMYRRKGEYTPEMLEDWRQHFLSLRDRFHPVEIVDTTRPEEQVRSDVVERIWRRYVDRWKTN